MAGFLSVLSSIGGLVQQYTSYKAQADYSEQLQRAEAQRAANVRALSAAQGESILKIADIEANVMELNAAILETNALNLQKAAEVDFERSTSDVIGLLGSQRTGFASAGVSLTGSALDVLNSSKEEGLDRVEQDFKQNINTVNQVFNASTTEKFNAAMTRFSADERARFLGLTTEQRLS